MEKIKEFFARYSYDSVKMLLDQFVLSIFGFSLAMASIHAKNDTLLLFTGIGAVIFYLVMLYSVAWKMGTTDRSAIEMGNRKFKPFMGTLVSLVANIPNFLVAITFMINSLVSDGTGVSGIIGRFINGMYLGLMTLIEFNGDHLHAYWWMYFLITLPSILVCTVAYIMGAKGRMFAKLMVPDLPASDRPTRKELKERREEEKRKGQ
ncbi:MAG: hypothetical protein IJW00_09510 [Clostridia bacterium]|nr:hypothetical protein [Clostridia bacterium]